MSQVVQVVFDIVSFFLAFLPCIILEFIGSPYRRGFFCDDESIKYPFKDDTISDTALVTTSILFPFVTFLLVEFGHVYKDLRSHNIPLYLSCRTNLFPWRLYTKAVYTIFVVFLFGLAVEQSLTDIGKFTTGRLRPHFLAVCQPDLTLLNCTVSDGALSMSAYVMIDDASCQKRDSYNLKNARLSFPSGHSSISAYVAIFLVLYLQMRLTYSRCRLLRHFLQAVFIYVAAFVCLSRISDYKHHSEDVLFGAFIGIFIASLVSLHIYYKSFKHTQRALLVSTNQDVAASMPNSSSMASVNTCGTHILIDEI